MFITEDNKAAIQYDRRMREISKSLRKHTTPSEYLLWQELRARKLTYKFRRQHALHGYIVDFYCYELMLVIEVDGEIHNTKLQHDEIRDRKLVANGYTVLRFTNEEVNYDMNIVLEIIKKQFPS